LKIKPQEALAGAGSAPSFEIAGARPLYQNSKTTPITSWRPSLKPHFAQIAQYRYSICVCKSLDGY